MPRTSTKDKEILEFLELFIKQNGYPPSVREICRAVGLKSTSTVHTQLKKLEAQGFIEKDGSKTRALRVTHLLANECEYITAPIVGNVAAGEPLLAEQDISEVLPLPMMFASNNPVFMLKVRGESMINVAILDGDYVIVEKTPVASNGDIVVALIEDSATVKTFYKENGKFRLQPENDTMSPFIVDSVVILGKVMGVLRHL